jgi:hypothetical protein
METQLAPKEPSLLRVMIRYPVTCGWRIGKFWRESPVLAQNSKCIENLEIFALLPYRRRHDHDSVYRHSGDCGGILCAWGGGGRRGAAAGPLLWADISLAADADILFASTSDNRLLRSDRDFAAEANGWVQIHHCDSSIGLSAAV